MSAAALALLLFLGACARRPAGPPPLPPVPPSADLVVFAYEVVQSEDEDGISSSRIYVDGNFAGRTESGRKSEEKRWFGWFPPGNHLIRLERWLLPRVGPWVQADGAEQPAERFFRINPGERLIIRLKYYDGGRRYAYEVSREPMVPEKKRAPKK